MYKWVIAGHYEEPDDSADDYLKAFFARELESAYNWTHGGKMTKIERARLEDGDFDQKIGESFAD